MDLMYYASIFFASIGVLFFTGVILYFISKRLQNYKPPREELYPDEEYMEKIGVVCPTGWTYRGKNRSGQYVCQNEFNVPIARPSKECYDDDVEKIKYFSPVKDWGNCVDNPQKCSSLNERCGWIEKCGPPSELSNNSSGSDLSNPYASWIGVQDKC